MNQVATEFWRGERPLSQAFWLLWVLGGVLVGLVAWLILLIGLYLLPGVSFATVVLASVLVLAFQLFCLVSVWRCAVNVKTRIWMGVSRVLVVLSGIQTVLVTIQTTGLVFSPIAEAL